MKQNVPNLLLISFITAISAPLSAQVELALASNKSDSEIIKLPSTEVIGQREKDQNYKATHTTSATKTDTLLRDIPQSITVVTEAQIKDQQMLSLADVVRYVPGVAAHQGENNRDQIIFRGNSSSADFFLNGVRDDVQYFRDLYNLERVEVLKGPNAMVFGRGGGGGVINRVSKEADFSPLREIVAQVGSYNKIRATVDLNEPINPHLAFRLNGMYENAESFRDYVSLKRYAINPTMTVVSEKNTKVTFGYEHLSDRRTADRGITSFQGRPADVPIETFYGNPDDSHVRANANFLSGTIEHQAGNLFIRNRTLFGDYDRFYQNYVPGAVNATKTQVALTAYNNDTQRKNIFNQTDLTYAASTGEIHHTLLGGVELGRQRTDNFRNTGYFNNTATSLTIPYGDTVIHTPVTFRQSATDADNHLKTDVAAVYAQDQIEILRQLQAIAGLRFDSFNLTYHNNRNGDTLGRKDNLVSPRAGLVYKPITAVSVYGSYSVSYLPSSGDQFSSLTTITQQVKPEKFTNYEAGIKWDIRNDFAFNAALYQLDRKNTRATDPNDPTRILQTGSQRTNGFEVGVSGSLTKDWSIAGGYAYQDASIRSATTAAVAGAQVGQVPHHTFSLWNKYQILPRWGVGLGVTYRSDMFVAVDNTVVVPGYTRVDAAVYFSLNDHWRIQANIENLLDRKYYTNADSNTNISPGSPIALRVGVITKF